MIQSFANELIRKAYPFEKNCFPLISLFGSDIQKLMNQLFANNSLENDSLGGDSIVRERIHQKRLFFDKNHF